MTVLHLNKSKSESEIVKNVLIKIQRKEPDNINQIGLKLLDWK